MPQTDENQSEPTPPIPLHEQPNPPGVAPLAFGATFVSFGVGMIVRHFADWATWPAFVLTFGVLTFFVGLMRRDEWVKLRGIALDRPVPPANGFVMVPRAPVTEAAAER